MKYIIIINYIENFIFINYNFFMEYLNIYIFYFIIWSNTLFFLLFLEIIFINFFYYIDCIIIFTINFFRR